MFSINSEAVNEMILFLCIERSTYSCHKGYFTSTTQTQTQTQTQMQEKMCVSPWTQTQKMCLRSMQDIQKTFYIFASAFASDMNQKFLYAKNFFEFFWVKQRFLNKLKQNVFEKQHYKKLKLRKNFVSSKI